MQPVKALDKLDDNPLLSNNQTVWHNADKFILDFKAIHPQYNPNGQPTMMCVHKEIIMDPYVMKEFAGFVNANIQRYEEKFGEIKVPENIKKDIEMMKAEAEKNVSKTEQPTYLG